jgi:DNA-directed RNA polymerase subunit RPC12/RpoP
MVGSAVLLWFLFMLLAGTLAVLMLHRNGSRSAGWAGLAVLGAAATAWLHLGSPPDHLLGALGFVAFAASFLGFRKAKPKAGRCHACGYDLRASEQSSATRCPECGTPLTSMEKHCLECRFDLHQAIARGGITCPNCRAPIDPMYLPDRG